MALLQPTQRDPKSAADRETDRVYFTKVNTSYRDNRQDPGPRRKVSVPIMSGSKLGGGARIRGGVL